MNDYLTGTSQQHCNCDTQAGTSNTAGYNAGISQGGNVPMNAPLSPGMSGSAVLDSAQFLNGYLQSYIGRSVTVQFLFGTDTLTDRTGTLMNVGANYITLREFGTNNLLICDFFSIKIVRVYQG